MRPVPDGPGAPANEAKVNDYDSFAEAYEAETEANLINGYYARPAILNLAGGRGRPAGSELALVRVGPVSSSLG